MLDDQDDDSADPKKRARAARTRATPAPHGFPVVRETNTDGWVFGAITDFVYEETGDGYVMAPDGSQAGVVWRVGTGPVKQIQPPKAQRWGVYSVSFPKPMRTTQDLITNFRAVLPQLKAKHEEHGG